MVESNGNNSSSASSSPAKKPKDRTPTETAELMKRLYKMPHTLLDQGSEVATSEHNSLFKVIIIGDSGVGKSCLMHRVTTNEFITDHEVTVGVEFGSLVIKLEQQVFKL